MPFQWEEEEEEEESHQVPSFLSLYRGKKWGKKNISPAGNRTPVFRVTGGDTHHYTTEEAMRNNKIKFVRFPSAYDHTTLNAPVLV